MSPRGDPPQWSPYDYPDAVDAAFVRAPFFDINSVRAAVQACLDSTTHAYGELNDYQARLKSLAIRLSATAKASNDPGLHQSAARLTQAVNVVEAAKTDLAAAHQSGQTYLNNL